MAVTMLALVLSVLRGMGPAGVMETVPGQEGGVVSINR